MTKNFITVSKKLITAPIGLRPNTNIGKISQTCFHKDDFNIKAEWHFSGTTHRKGPCDDVGGSVKRLAAQASLQCSYENQIQTPL